MYFKFKCPDGEVIIVDTICGDERFKEMLNHSGISYEVV